jgi:OOP family OmpA-OmpF porin
VIIVRRIVVFLLFILIASVFPTLAAENGFLLGGGVGRSSIEIRKFYPDIGNDPDNPDPGFQDQHNSAYRFYAGYRFLKFLSIEVGYTDLGSPQVWETTVQEHPEQVEVSVKGMNAFAVGIIPVGESVDLFGKIGMVAWDTTLRSEQDGEVKFSETDSGTDLAYGIGFGWWVGKHVALRLELENYTIGDFDDVSAYSVGISYTF